MPSSMWMVDERAEDEPVAYDCPEARALRWKSPRMCGHARPGTSLAAATA
jgi:hypothetical protein